MEDHNITRSDHPPINPCPFCGDKGPKIDDFDGAGGDVFAVQCGNCEAMGPIARIGCRDAEHEAGTSDLELEAILMWNQWAIHGGDEAERAHAEVGRFASFLLAINNVIEKHGAGHGAELLKTVIVDYNGFPAVDLTKWRGP